MQTSQIRARYGSSPRSSHPPLVVLKTPFYSDRKASTLVAHPASFNPSVLNSRRSKLPGRRVQTRMFQRWPSLLRKQSVTTLILTMP